MSRAEVLLKLMVFLLGEAAQKHCKTCGALLVQRATERPDTFGKRTTCGRECGKALTRLMWDQNPPIYKYLRYGERF